MDDRPTRNQADAPAAARRGLVVGFRALAYGQATLAMLQAVTAGHLLAGNVDARSVHNVVGSDVMLLVVVAQLLTAVLLWKPGSGPAWPLLVLVPLAGLLVAQINWGFDGRLALHVPTGVAFLIVQVLLALAPLSARRASR